jgi:hypothetical protein
MRKRRATGRYCGWTCHHPPNNRKCKCFCAGLFHGDEGLNNRLRFAAMKDFVLRESDASSLPAISAAVASRAESNARAVIEKLNARVRAKRAIAERRKVREARRHTNKARREQSQEQAGA